MQCSFFWIYVIVGMHYSIEYILCEWICDKCLPHACVQFLAKANYNYLIPNNRFPRNWRASKVNLSGFCFLVIIRESHFCEFN